VITSSYSSGPIGRIDAANVVKLINFYEAQSRNNASECNNCHRTSGGKMSEPMVLEVFTDYI
jgi:hypothetical protein